ncbi:hypothetical protein [Dyadobacter arcticus]|uniref:Uncharacterized protein n=1 Tax=Dyadobacter arcticus TaxID=1078754 RepID=A0ABX0UFY7_9BACT|nr:hypothetical protein [Dyadobacter arcticus]NIJ51919.1 hypothetical protein [Dyadobacter arcticus]
MNQHNRYKKRFGLFPVFALAAALILGLVIRLLWNAILPYALNANPISYWQAVGLFVLCKILFGGFRGPMGGPDRWNKWQNFDKGGMPGKSPFSDWRNKWMGMSDEERIKFRQEMRRRCGKPPENT